MSFDLVRAAMAVEGWIPAKKLLLCVLADVADKNGVCWPEYDFLMRRTGLKRSALYDYVEELDESGHLSRFRDKEGRRCFRVHCPSLRENSAVAEKKSAPADKSDGRNSAPAEKERSEKSATADDFSATVEKPEAKKIRSSGQSVRSSGKTEAEENPLQRNDSSAPAEKSVRSSGILLNPITSQEPISEPKDIASASDATSRKPDELFDTIGKVLALNPNEGVIGKNGSPQNGGLIGKVKQVCLAQNPPVTPDEIRKAGEIYAKLHPVNRIPNWTWLSQHVTIARNPDAVRNAEFASRPLRQTAPPASRGFAQAGAQSRRLTPAEIEAQANDEIPF